MTIQTIKNNYENSAGVKVVFYDKGIKIGEACTVYFNGKPNSFLHGLEVNEQFRNNGYGSSIVEYMINKYDVDTLYVERRNIIAIELYNKFGFKTIQSFDENFIIMKRI